MILEYLTHENFAKTTDAFIQEKAVVAVKGGRGGPGRQFSNKEGLLDALLVYFENGNHEAFFRLVEV